MKIEKLNIDYAEDITYMLANYLLDSSSEFFYKISFEILFWHVKKRLLDPNSSVSYIWIIDKYTNLLWFVSYNENTETNEFEILCIVDTDLEDYQKDALINYCVDKYMEGKYSKITTELRYFEQDLSNIFGKTNTPLSHEYAIA